MIVNFQFSKETNIWIGTLNKIYLHQCAWYHLLLKYPNIKQGKRGLGKWIRNRVYAFDLEDLALILRRNRRKRRKERTFKWQKEKYSLLYFHLLLASHPSTSGCHIIEFELPLPLSAPSNNTCLSGMWTIIPPYCFSYSQGSQAWHFSASLIM